MKYSLRFSIMPAFLVAALVLAVQDRSVEVRVNGTALGNAITTDQALHAKTVYLPLSALQRAVDGEGATRARLRISESALYAAATGSCGECALQVNRTVMISSKLRFIDGVPYVPLPDIVRALEGRLTTNATHGVVTIHVGRCDWCILEPRR